MNKIQQWWQEPKKCMFCGSLNVQLHHCFTYAGRQIEELWNYVPVCAAHHAECTPHNNKYKSETRRCVELHVLKQMTVTNAEKYPKKNWLQMLQNLTK